MNTPMEFTVDDARNCLTVVGALCELAGRAVKENRCGSLDGVDSDLFDSIACLTNKALEFYDQERIRMGQELRTFREAATPAPVAKRKRAEAAA